MTLTRPLWLKHHGPPGSGSRAPLWQASLCQNPGMIGLQYIQLATLLPSLPAS